MFSEALVDYVYEKTGVKCDCVDYSTDYQLYDDQDGGYFNSRFAYNVKKKKKVRLGESADDRQSLDDIIYEFLDGEYYPDYGWESSFYPKEVEEYGAVTFYVNDIEGYYYYADGTLEVNPWVCNGLDIWFSDSWKIPFKKWFEKNSDLKVKLMWADNGSVPF
jgi:hypothetical protein